MLIIKIISLTILFISVLYANKEYPYIEPVAIEVAPVLDNDKDGVPNNIDKCPDTKVGEKVNDYGCLHEVTIILADNKKTKNAIIVSTQAGSTTVDKVNQFVKIHSKTSSPSQAQDISKKEIDKMFPYISKQEEVSVVHYTLYFKDIDSLNTDSKEKLLKIIDEINKRKNAVITISGYTDTLGSEQRNIDVAQKRVESVAKALKDHGINYLKLELKAVGEKNLAIETPDDTYEPFNRRVEILIR